jgi:integrase
MSKQPSSHYIDVATIGSYRIVRSASNDSLYLSWYDAQSRQTRRRSLKIQNVEKACSVARSIVERGVTGDPKDALVVEPLRTVSDILEWHRPYTQTLASAEAEGIQIERLKRLIGNQHIALMVPVDFDSFRDTCIAQDKISLATVSRTLSTLRSGIRRAADNKLVARQDVPKIPEYRTKAIVRAAPPKGRVMTLEELARLIDQVDQLHLLVFLIVLINTACRPGAAIELETDQIELQQGLLHLNPAQRVQTKKFRPSLPITETLRPWLDGVPPAV